MPGMNFSDILYAWFVYIFVNGPFVLSLAWLKSESDDRVHVVPRCVLFFLVNIQIKSQQGAECHVVNVMKGHIVVVVFIFFVNYTSQPQHSPMLCTSTFYLQNIGLPLVSGTRMFGSYGFIGLASVCQAYFSASCRYSISLK